MTDFISNLVQNITDSAIPIKPAAILQANPFYENDNQVSYAIQGDLQNEKFTFSLDHNTASHTNSVLPQSATRDYELKVPSAEPVTDKISFPEQKANKSLLPEQFSTPAVEKDIGKVMTNAETISQPIIQTQIEKPILPKSVFNYSEAENLDIVPKIPVSTNTGNNTISQVPDFNQSESEFAKSQLVQSHLESSQQPKLDLHDFKINPANPAKVNKTAINIHIGRLEIRAKNLSAKQPNHVNMHKSKYTALALSEYLKPKGGE